MGAFLDGGTGNTNDDILLHINQQTEEVHIGDSVTVFLYHDPSGRLTASMRLPKIKIGQIGYAPVINTTRFGAFVDVGTERGIFMPFAEMKGRLKKGSTSGSNSMKTSPTAWPCRWKSKTKCAGPRGLRQMPKSATGSKGIYNMNDQGPTS